MQLSLYVDVAGITWLADFASQLSLYIDVADITWLADSACG